MTTNPPPSSTGSPASSTTTADPPASNAELDARLDRVEGAIGRIERALTGGQSSSPAAGQGPGPAGQDSSSAAGQGGVDVAAIQRQVLDQIRQADQRRAAEQDETKWRDGVNQAVEAMRRERMPREPETGVRGTLQRMLIGRPRGG